MLLGTVLYCTVLYCTVLCAGVGSDPGHPPLRLPPLLDDDGGQQTHRLPPQPLQDLDDHVATPQQQQLLTLYLASPEDLPPTAGNIGGDSRIQM